MNAFLKCLVYVRFFLRKGPLIRHALCALTFAQAMTQSSSAEEASRLYAQASGSVVQLVTESADGKRVQGTGFLIEGGKVATNAHVVSGKNVVIDLGIVRIPAVVDKTDTLNDLAILSPAMPLDAKPLPISDRLPEPGSTVYAIGNPQGLEKTLSSGIVSAVRILNGRQLVQITSPLSSGSSGGPVMDRDGTVIGVAVAIIENGQNLNFAVPSTSLLRMIKGETPATPRPEAVSMTSISEVELESILRELEITFEKTKTNGVLIYSVSSGESKFALFLDEKRISLMDGFNDPVPLETVNRWNKKTNRGRAYLDDDRDVVVEDTLNVTGGVSRQAVKDFINDFPIVVLSFAVLTTSDKDGADENAPTHSEQRRVKSPSATKKIKAQAEEFSVWIDPKIWTVKPSSDPSKPERVYFEHQSKGLFAFMIAEALTVTPADLEKFVLQDFKNKASNVSVVARETRVVNGKKVLALTVDATVDGVAVRYLGYYYTGSAGTVQLLSWASKSIFDSNLTRLENFLNGLEVDG
jgi:S1-C subfamily serine protease